MTKHWLVEFNEFPPALCRWVARKRHGTKPMSTRDIARISGLSRSGVDKLSKLIRWNTVGAETMHRFSLACGVNLKATARQKEFVRRRALIYLENATPSQRRMLKGIESLLCSRGRSPT